MYRQRLFVPQHLCNPQGSTGGVRCYVSSKPVSSIQPQGKPTNVKRRFPSHLRIHSEDHLGSTDSSGGKTRDAGGRRELDEVDICLRAFAEATSWGVVPQSSGNAHSTVATASPTRKWSGRQWKLIDNIVRDGLLDEVDLSAIPSVPMDKAQELLLAIERLVERLDRAEEVIRRQEAELATAVLVTSHPDRQKETADRLESILESTSRSIGSVAAAVYLLDDATSNLKMRSCFGLPRKKLAAPPRELRGSLADLEALLGNAVLLSDIEMMPEWPSPEAFASALVVPIGTSSMPHGTIWFWSENPRTFSPTEVEVANLASGRVMAEIEQSILGHEVSRSREVQKQIDTASLTQASMLPDTQILHEDFDISGWTHQSSGLGGAFHHWDIVPSGMMTFAIGQASHDGPEGSIVATGALAMVRTLWNQGANPSQILRAINDLNWSMVEADWKIALSLLQFNPVTGYGSLCNSGEMQSFIVSCRGCRPIGNSQPLVGAQPDSQFNASRFILQPGEILVSYTPNLFLNRMVDAGPMAGAQGFSAADSAAKKPLDQTGLLNIVRDLCDESANDIAGYLARLLTQPIAQSQPNHDRSLILIKNIRKPIP
jgi:sigma-B regulation protein RsbU (phosphoserine phosphatase)